MVKISYIKKINIDGLYYIDDIKIDTSNMVSELDKLEWTKLSSNINSRKVQHYGFKYNYSTSNIKEKTDELPYFLEPLKNMLTKFCRKLKLIDDKYEFNQCIINNYESGQGISSHIDTLSYGHTIGCFTIGSGAIMKFTKDKLDEELFVEKDSLYIMSGDARYKWKHSMPARKKDNDKLRDRRISITFRNVPL